MGLCSDSTSYYRVFGPCLDFSLIPCEEKKLFHFWCILTDVSSNQERLCPSSNQDRLGWALGAVNPPTLDYDWRKDPAYHPFEN